MLYKIQQQDLDKAVQVLARAFINYPLFEYLIPDYEYRKRTIDRLLSFIVNSGWRRGEVVAPSQDIEGISIWVRFNHMNPSIKETLQAGAVNALFHVNLETTVKGLGVVNRKQQERAKILTFPYYFLEMIGVDPSLQGNGYGRMMIENKLMEFDHENVPCYLETSLQGNVNYYQRYGFDLIHQYKIGKVPVYCLLRKAR